MPNLTAQPTVPVSRIDHANPCAVGGAVTYSRVPGRGVSNEVPVVGGMRIERLFALLDKASEQRLAAFRDALQRRWGLRSLEWNSDNSNTQQPGMSLLAARAVHADVRSALATIRAERDHRANPVRVEQSPVSLKRGVSWREMLHVIESGAVIGKLNAWHIGDGRKLVFFCSSEISDCVALSQANDLTRQAIVCLSEERGVPIGPWTVDQGDIQRWIEAEIVSRSASDWTSAVIDIRSRAGAEIWPRGNRTNLMGNVDEYGLPPGAVTAADVSEVRLYKETELVFEGSLLEASYAVLRLRGPTERKSAPAFT